MPAYLTGAHVKKTTTDIHVDGPMSMDQVIAGQNRQPDETAIA